MNYFYYDDGDDEDEEEVVDGNDSTSTNDFDLSNIDAQGEEIPGGEEGTNLTRRRRNNRFIR